jgi:hypothetical protein
MAQMHCAPTISSVPQRHNANFVSKKVAKETATSLEDLIEVAHARGLRINNLYQFEDGWRANVNYGKEFYEFGKGKTAAEALRAALEKAKRAGH